MGQKEESRERPRGQTGIRKLLQWRLDGQTVSWLQAGADCPVKGSELEILKFYIRITSAS
jgi:hypothetical protein